MTNPLPIESISLLPGWTRQVQEKASNDCMETSNRVIEWGYLHTNMGASAMGILGDNLAFWQFIEAGETPTLTPALTKIGEGLLLNQPRVNSWVHKYLVSPDSENGPIPILLAGSDFQKTVWRELSAILPGEIRSYQHIASKMGRPKAVRAVASAIGANALGYLVPCHRVVRSDGGLGGYRWGVDLKQKMLEWERHQSLSG